MTCGIIIWNENDEDSFLFTALIVSTIKEYWCPGGTEINR
jgi:hypothetical protein